MARVDSGKAVFEADDDRLVCRNRLLEVDGFGMIPDGLDEVLDLAEVGISIGSLSMRCPG